MRFLSPILLLASLTCAVPAGYGQSADRSSPLVRDLARCDNVDAVAGILLRPPRFFTSARAQPRVTRMETTLEQICGIKFDDVLHIVVLLEHTPSQMDLEQVLESPTVLIRFTGPQQRQAFVARMLPGMVPVEFAGQTYYRAGENSPLGPACGFNLDEAGLILAPEGRLQRLLSRPPATVPSAVARTLRKAHPQFAMAGFCKVDVLREIMQSSFGSDVKAAAASLKDFRSLLFAIHPGKTTAFSAHLQAKDELAAQRLAAMLSFNLALAKTHWADLQAQQKFGEGDPSEAAFRKVSATVEPVLDQLKVAHQSNRVEMTLNSRIGVIEIIEAVQAVEQIGRDARMTFEEVARELEKVEE